MQALTVASLGPGWIRLHPESAKVPENIISLQQLKPGLPPEVANAQSNVGKDCDYVCKGETEEELMKNAEQHAVQDHHYKLEEIMTPELQQKIKSHIKRS